MTLRIFAGALIHSTPAKHYSIDRAHTTDTRRPSQHSNNTKSLSREHRLRKIAIAIAVAATAGGLITGSGPAAADDFTVQACYDNAKPYNKPSGPASFPYNGTWLTATANCNDINIRPHQTTTVYVCFAPSSGGVSCQTRLTHVSAGSWGVVATNVANGTRFRFEFLFPTAQSGVYAA